jgi:hypothetical protein
LSFKSFKASVANAQAGSTTIQSSFKYSKIVEQTLFSGHLIISSFSFLQISKVFSHSFFTAAPSTKVSICSSSISLSCFKLSAIALAQVGSTQIIFVFGLIKFFAIICPEINHPHQIGHM